MGFREYFEYSANFDRLECQRMSTSEEHEYLNHWKCVYRQYMQNADDLKKCYFGLRVYRAKKEIYCSAQMFIEAGLAKQSGCLTAFYFLCYYSLMHAMQGVLFLNPNIPDEKVIKLSHASIQKYFQDYYCKGRKSIISDMIIPFLVKLRTFREYYSYTMPWNHGVYETVDMEELETYLAGCYQLTNLHNMILYSVQRGANTPLELRSKVQKYFIQCCCKLHPDTEQPMIEEADKDTMSDFMKGGFGYEPPLITYEHDYDEYGGYDFSAVTGWNSNQLSEVRRDTLRLIYRIIV